MCYFGYDYDAASRIVSTRREDGGIIYYGYDGADRLTSETWYDSQWNEVYGFAWDYDMAGNRAWQRRGSVETYYLYDAANALIRAHELPSDTWSYFEYDERGNCRTMQEPAGTTYFDYNSRNLVTAIRFGTGTCNYFWYDAQGRRYALEDSDGVSYFTWDRNGMNLLSERDASGNATADYVHGWTPIDGIGSCLAIRRTNGGTTRLYPLTNNHGDVIAIVDSAGSTVARYEYDAWGNLLREDVTAIGLRLGYQSNWLTLKDSPSRRLKLSPTRWYDAVTGRFGQRDPEGILAGSYIYAKQEPLLTIDAAGLSEESWKDLTRWMIYNRRINGPTFRSLYSAWKGNIPKIYAYYQLSSPDWVQVIALVNAARTTPGVYADFEDDLRYYMRMNHPRLQGLLWPRGVSGFSWIGITGLVLGAAIATAGLILVAPIVVAVGVLGGTLVAIIDHAGTFSEGCRFAKSVPGIWDLPALFNGLMSLDVNLKKPGDVDVVLDVSIIQKYPNTFGLKPFPGKVFLFPLGDLDSYKTSP